MKKSEKSPTDLSRKIDEALDHLQRGFLKLQRKGMTSLVPMDFSRAFFVLKKQ